MIVVTGATGALNGATVDHLATLVPPGGLAVAVRDPDRATGFAERGIAVRRGDYADPASLPAAFEGADQLLLVSSNDPTADHVALHRAAVEAAVEAGVGRILYTSHQGAAAANPFRPCQVHAATEGLLAASGLAWTSLRNGFYAHTLGWLVGDWRTTGRVVVPADGPVSWTSREDSAEAAAVVLASDGAYDGPVTITATAAPTFAEVAEHLSATLDVVGEDAWLAEQVAAGQPEGAARFTLGIFQGAHGGFFAGTDPLLGTLLGRDPAPWSAVLR